MILFFELQFSRSAYQKNTSEASVILSFVDYKLQPIDRFLGADGV